MLLPLLGNEMETAVSLGTLPYLLLVGYEHTYSASTLLKVSTYLTYLLLPEPNPAEQVGITFHG